MSNPTWAKSTRWSFLARDTGLVEVARQHGDDTYAIWAYLGERAEYTTATSLRQAKSKGLAMLHFMRCDAEKARGGA